MDFITDLPPSKRKGCVYNAILVIVDQILQDGDLCPNDERPALARILRSILINVKSSLNLVCLRAPSQIGEVYSQASTRAISHAKRI